MRNYARYLKYVTPLAAVALSFAVPGVLGWILRWGGVAVLGDRVFMVTDHAHLIALDRTTGGLIWVATGAGCL